MVISVNINNAVTLATVPSMLETILIKLVKKDHLATKSNHAVEVFGVAKEPRYLFSNSIDFIN